MITVTAEVTRLAQALVDAGAVAERAAPISHEVRLTASGFFGEDQLSLEQTLRFRIGEALTTDTEWECSKIELPGGSFVANRWWVRASYSFTPNVFLQALVQYTDIANFWSTNVRFGWLHSGATRGCSSSTPRRATR